jgi:uncharacterized membrane protein YhaH (DUF805 family)
MNRLWMILSFVFALTALILALIESRKANWQSPTIWAVVLLALAFLLAFGPDLLLTGR